MDPSAALDPMRGARTFRPRRRGLSPRASAEFERVASVYLVDPAGGRLELPSLFGRSGDVVLDIGFGGGEALLELAEARPDEAVLGVEVHTPGVARVATTAAARGWDHVRVVATDVLEVLPRLDPATLAGIRVWFPDPWPKQRQRHRRLLRAEVVHALVDRLRVGGVLHVATDIADYAADVRAAAGTDERLRGGVIERPAWRPVTRFERRGLAAGRSAIDLWFERVQ